MSLKTLFPKWYYHGKVWKHQDLKKLLMEEMDSADLAQPEDWNCTLKSSFKTGSNFSWNVFYDSIKPNISEMHQQLGGTNDTSMRMLEAWINSYTKGDSQEIHTHITPRNSVSTFSCAYFVQYEKEDAKFQFYDPDQSKYLGNFAMHYPTFGEYTPEVTEGDILIFPSHQHHHVSIHQSNNTRITVSANFAI